MDEKPQLPVPPPIERMVVPPPVEDFANGESFRHDRTAAARDQRRAQPEIRLRWLAWAGLVLIFLWMLPGLVERLQYAITRGRERAEVDITRAQLPSEGLQDISRQFAIVAKAIKPSVVHVDAMQSVGGRGRRWSQQEQIQGQGTGVIVDEAGYVLTNAHVVDGADRITVRLSGNESRSAEIVGLDELTDLAVIKIDAGGLVAAEWGDSDALQVGSLVWAVGNPFGLDHSVTFGIISAMHRHVEDSNALQDFLQTDAAVNPGNSGGPLVDGTGKIVGINTAIVGPAYRGVSFSIPSSVAKDVYEGLRKQGRVERGFLGVIPANLEPETVQRLKLSSLEGALIERVDDGTPAARAKIQADDVIVEWNGQPVSDGAQLKRLVARTKVGSKANAVIVREGQRIATVVTVEERAPSLASGRR